MSIFGTSTGKRPGQGEYYVSDPEPVKTAMHVLTVMYGPAEGARLAALPDSDSERQNALADAALAGEIVGDPLPIVPMVFFGWNGDVQ